MKALIYPALIVLGLFISCGPTAEQKAEEAKQIQDSITAANAQMEAAKDAARQQAIDDSIAQAEAAIVDSIQ